MDTSPEQHTMRLEVEISRTPDDRLEGRMRANSNAWTFFSGVLELLKALEELLDGEGVTGRGPEGQTGG
jgi:hypothetical protein